MCLAPNMQMGHIAVVDMLAELADDPEFAELWRPADVANTTGILAATPLPDLTCGWLGMMSWPMHGVRAAAR